MKNPKNMPSRKPNRLKGFDYAEFGAYFITICVKNRTPLLGNIVLENDLESPQVCLSAYGKITEFYLKRIAGIDKYVIMPDHIHMILLKWDIPEKEPRGAMWASPPTKSSTTISQDIRSFKILVTKQIGFSIWQRSFYDRILRNDKEYEQVWDYIENNPLLWLEGKDHFYGTY